MPINVMSVAKTLPVCQFQTNRNRERNIINAEIAENIKNAKITVKSMNNYSVRTPQNSHWTETVSN